MKKLIDERGRLFGRLNVLDALVLLAVVLLAAGLVLRAQRLAALQTEDDKLAPPEEAVPVTYEVTVYNASIGHVEDIRVGDTLYNRDTSGINVGTIVDMKVTECSLPVQLVDGSYVMGTARDRYRIVLTVESEVRPTRSGRMFINWNSELAAGMTYNYCTKYCLVVGVVTAMDWDEQALEVWNDYLRAEENGV